MAVALVVEHDDDIRHLVSLSAAKAGLDPVPADCGEAAMTLIADGLKPDVVVLDVRMPGISGLDVVRAMRAHRYLEATPVVMLSAMARPEDRQDGLEAGADEYVLKPFSPRALTIVLRDLVARTRPAS
ncbi:response regulator [Pedococcus sp. KACC 23699]|uniref:Response regulator n=1 Tax=Pedococcus sp. KACC 23699 TaxID=3149228 RepID=A0AAU7JXZ0_9MICO